jgi:hypothetical protein
MTTTESSTGGAPVPSMSRAPTIAVAPGAEDVDPLLPIARQETMNACVSLVVLVMLITPLRGS